LDAPELLTDPITGSGLLWLLANGLILALASVSRAREPAQTHFSSKTPVGLIRLSNSREPRQSRLKVLIPKRQQISLGLELACRRCLDRNAHLNVTHIVGSDQIFDMHNANG
jgi:hypothetical protein